jgi:hypothetical protein
MTSTANGDTSGWTPAQIRLLKMTVIVLGILLVLGFMVLLAGLYHKIGKVPASKTVPAAMGAALDTAPPERLPPLNIPLKRGEQLMNFISDQDRLILRLHAGDEDQFVIIDLTTGTEVQRITLKPQ